MVPLDQPALPGLEKMVQDYVEGIVSLDARSPEFAKKAESVRTMGDADIRAAAESAMDARPARAWVAKGGFEATSQVSQSLLDLRKTIEGLDPAKASGVRKLLGIIPFGDQLRDYFHRYESAEIHINAILNALYQGQDELRRTTRRSSRRSCTCGRRCNASLSTCTSSSASTHPFRRPSPRSRRPTPKAKTLKDDVLFYVRQKHQDLLTQLAVAIQGYLAIDLVRKNNIELIKGVDRATTTTISALRTAVVVAQALANQRLVLNQITALNTTTSNMIESTSKLLASQSVAINEQAGSSTIGIDKLEAASRNPPSDGCDRRLQGAGVESMQTTIDTLSAEIQIAELPGTGARFGPRVTSEPNRPEELKIPGNQR